MSQRKGFTLIELVVVVMILGILAAVAAPKLLGTSGTATDNGVKQTLAVVRDAIERYTAENGGTKPTMADANTIKTELGSYLRGNFPKCPVGANPDAVVTIKSAGTALTADGTTGWMYDNKSGEFIINSHTKASDSTTFYDAM